VKFWQEPEHMCRQMKGGENHDFPKTILLSQSEGGTSVS